MTFTQWIKYLKVLSIFMAALGVLWAVLGSFDPFGIYDSAWAQNFYGTHELAPDIKKASSFLLAPFGATSAAYFLMQYFIIKNALARKEKWAWQALIIAFLFWLILDSAMTIYHGAYFNLWFANLPCLIFTLPLFFGGKFFRQSR